MQIGIDSFVQTISDPALRTPTTDFERIQHLLEEIELADRVGIDTYAIGEHHRKEFLASSPAVILAAAAARTSRIRLASAVTVLSSDDPIRVYQQFATLDLISGGRAEIIAGRGSFIESYPLFGYDLSQYDQLFTEKLDLLLAVRKSIEVHWSGESRPPLTGQAVYPRSMQTPLPIRLGVGGTPASFTRAGVLGLPLTVAIIGGEPRRFRPLVELYRRAWLQSGHDPEGMDVAVHTMGFLADTDQEAADLYYPGYKKLMDSIGRERGWPPSSRAQYDAEVGPFGSKMVGGPQSIAAKIRGIDEALGGVSGVSVLIDSGTIPHEKVMRAIELLGTEVKAALI